MRLNQMYQFQGVLRMLVIDTLIIWLIAGICGIIIAGLARELIGLIIVWLLTGINGLIRVIFG